MLYYWLKLFLIYSNSWSTGDFPSNEIAKPRPQQVWHNIDRSLLNSYKYRAKALILKPLTINRGNSICIKHFDWNVLKMELCNSIDVSCSMVIFLNTDLSTLWYASTDMAAFELKYLIVLLWTSLFWRESHGIYGGCMSYSSSPSSLPGHIKVRTPLYCFNCLCVYVYGLGSPSFISASGPITLSKGAIQFVTK